MALLIICVGEDVSGWEARFREIDPLLDLRIWPHVGERADVLLALVWNHPPGELKGYPNLKCIASMGAGVEAMSLIATSHLK